MFIRKGSAPQLNAFQCVFAMVLTASIAKTGTINSRHMETENSPPSKMQPSTLP